MTRERELSSTHAGPFVSAESSLLKSCICRELFVSAECSSKSPARDAKSPESSLQMTRMSAESSSKSPARDAKSPESSLQMSRMSAALQRYIYKIYISR